MRARGSHKAPTDRVLFGLRPVIEAMSCGRRRVFEIWLADGRGDDPVTDALQREAAKRGVPIHRVGRSEIERRASSPSHQGVVAAVEPLPVIQLDSITGVGEKDLVVALDGVQDPQNLGAIIRTAVSAGASAVIAPRDRSVKLTASAAKAAEGAAEHIALIEVTNLTRAIITLQERGYWAVGFDMDADHNLWQANCAEKTIMVLGGEGRGLRRLVKETCDDLVAIPMLGPIESLNVAAVAAIGLFEAVRQRTARL